MARFAGAPGAIVTIVVDAIAMVHVIGHRRIDHAQGKFEQPDAMMFSGIGGAPLAQFREPCPGLLPQGW